MAESDWAWCLDFPKEASALLDERWKRILELEAALRLVRQAIVEKADDSFWLSPIETVVDHIDAALGEYADDQAEM